MVDADPIVQAFNDVNQRRKRWAIVKVDTSSNYTLEATGERDDGIEQCKAALPNNEPRYVLFDFEAQKEDGSKLNKTVFVAYSPDDCTSMPMKFALMNYAAAVKAKASYSVEKQINDINDFNENEFRGYFNLPPL